MAFVDFNEATPRTLAASTFPSLPANPAVAHADRLTTIERRIVELAREDGLDTLRPPRKRGWFARLILGPAPASPMLANEKLEALRRLAVRAWRQGYSLPASALREAQVAGYSEDQIGSVIDSIARSRAPFRSIAA